jgi:hypothetical protein
MPRRNATGVVCIFLIWGIDDVYIVLFTVKPLTVSCAGLSLLLVLIVVFLVVRDRSKRKVSYHNLGLGTKYVFLHVGWVQNLNLFSVVFLLVSTRAIPGILVLKY